jgi:hypothetical protein
VSSLRRDVAKLTHDLNDFKADVLAAFGTLAERLGALTEQVGTLTDQLGTLTGRLEARGVI